MLIRQFLVAVSLFSLLTAGLAALPSSAAPAVAADEPGLLEPENVPLVPAVPLDDPDYEVAESDKAPSLPLPNDVDDLPSDVSATVPAGETWEEVPEAPVEVMVEEPATDEPGTRVGPNSQDEPGSNVPDGADVEVELIRPEDLDRAVLLLDLGVSPDVAGTPQEPEDAAPSEPVSPSEEPSPTGADESPESEGPSGSPDKSGPTPDAPATTTEPEAPAEPEGSEPPSDGERVPAESVSVRVSYADFEQLFGGRWSDRLEVRAYPACFATTPEEPECAVGAPVKSVNDAGSNELVFTTVPTASVAEAIEDSPEVSEDDSTSGPAELLAAAEGSSGVVYALAAGTGKFDAVPFNTATSWQAGTGSGEFSYSYPFELPAALGGATPSLSLNYSSATVDAMTAENSQATGSGTGWSDLTPGFITRSFASCEDDQPAGAHEFDDRGDLCWGTRADNGQEVEELSLSMNGRSSKLRRIFQQGVSDPGAGEGVVTHEYRLYDDPGWRVLRRFEPDATPQAGVDNDRERWLVITPDGTRYHFGSGNGGYGSTWTVPVFGNAAGEPCHAASLANSVCHQAWQWNLNQVTDPHGNQIHYSYQVQTNSYDPYGPDGRANYTRAGMLDKIEYGFRSAGPGSPVGPPRQVVDVQTDLRCLAAVKTPGTFCSDSLANAGQWPDVPIDLICRAGDDPCPSKGPAFFNTRRYWKVETSTREGSGAGTEVPVATYTLGHTLPDVDGRTIYNTNGGEQADLWLDSVGHTGHVGGANTRIPHVLFEGKAFANRVQVPAGEEALEKFRIFAVRNELGGRIDVSYGHATGRACTGFYVNGLAGRWLSARECFTGRNPADDGFEWFHKYVVTRVAQSDDALHYRVGRPSSTPSLGSVRITDYTYYDDPAWRYRNSRNIKRAKESWDDWRGYERTDLYTRKVTNQAQSGTHSINRTVRFRGMNRSLRNPDGTMWENRRVTTKEANDGGEGGDPGAGSGPVDEPWLNGMTAETSTQHPDGTLVERGYTGYKSYNLNTPSNIGLARRVWTARSTTTTRTTSGANPGQRRHTVRYGTHEGGADHRGILAGAPKWASDQGDDAVSGDNETCSTTDWKTNPDLWMMAEQQTRLYAGACGADGAATGDLSARTQKFYDHEEDNSGNALTRGLLTRSTTYTGPGEDDEVKVSTETDYDAYGRVTETRDPRGNQTTTEYNPSGSPANLLTELKLTQVQEPGPDLVTLTTMEPAKGLPTEVVDPNGGSTRMTYDGLGRPLKMFAPRNNSSTPTIEHGYENSLRRDGGDPLSMDKPASVITLTQLGSPSSTTTVPTVTFYDGWGRTIEAQQMSPAAGRRLVTSTGYDDRGLARLSTAAYSSTQPNVGEIVNPDPATLPRYSLTSYDSAQRPVEVQDMTLGTEYRKATTSYLGDATVQVPPGSGATHTNVDVWDRPTRVELHTNAAGTDLEDAADYRYTTTGQLDTITKNIPIKPALGPEYTWDYDYDWAGRKTKAVDPDTGTIDYAYDPAGNLTLTTVHTLDGGMHAKYATEYDDLNRPTSRDDVTNLTPLTNPTPLARWTYDTAENGLGMLAESTSIVHANGTSSPGITPPLGLGAAWEYTKAVVGYDADGNATGTRVAYPGWLTGEAPDTQDVTHTYGYTSTATGEPATVAYPETPGFENADPDEVAFTVDYSYEATGGRLGRMKVGANHTLADARYDAIGQPSSLSTYNTTDATMIRYYQWELHTGRPGQVTGIEAGPGTAGAVSDPGISNPIYLLDLKYKYDTADNPLRVGATLQVHTGGPTVEAAWCYGYDGLNRLTRAYNGTATAPAASTTTCDKHAAGTTPGAVVAAVTGPLHDLGYTYSGDRLATVKTPGAGTATGTVAYGWDSSRPHATTHLTGSGTATAAGMPPTTLVPISYSNGVGNAVNPPGSERRDYDRQGQLTQDLSLLSGADAIVSQYAYDADGMRIARRTVEKSCLTCITTTTVFLPDGTEINRPLTGAATSTHHIATPGGTPLTSIEPAGPTWAFADPQGTIRLTRGPTGTVDRFNYYPHGDPTTTGAPATPGERGYLNKTHDPNGDLRLDHRSYTPTLNILTTPDPLLAPDDPQSLNPYSYARNNPITLGDPSGLRPTCTSGTGPCGPPTTTQVVATGGGIEPSSREQMGYQDLQDAGLGQDGCGSLCDNPGDILAGAATGTFDAYLLGNPVTAAPVLLGAPINPLEELSEIAGVDTDSERFFWSRLLGIPIPGVGAAGTAGRVSGKGATFGFKSVGRWFSSRVRPKPKPTPAANGAAPRFIGNSAGDILDTTRVTIPEGKFGYLLKNPSKSGVFKDSMGFDQAGLDSALRSHLTTNFGNASRSVPMTGGGSKFVVRGPLTGPSGQTWNITSAWGVDVDGTIRLITATP